MADVTVNIRGNSEQLKRELQDINNQGAGGIGTANVSNQPPASQTMSAQTGGIIERVTSDLFTRFQAQLTAGGTLDKNYLSDVSRTKIQEANDAISKKYEIQREDIRKNADKKYDEIDKNIEAQRKQMLGQMGNPNDPLALRILDKKMEDMRGAEYDKVIKGIGDEEEALKKAEIEEKAEVEKELIEAIRNLADEYKNTSERQPANDNSYIGKLRDERRRLLEERDASDDQQGALAKQKELDAVNEKLRPFESTKREKEQETDYDKYALRILGMSTGALNATRNLGEGNIGGVVQGTGMAIGSAMGGKSGMAVSGITAVLGAVWDIVEMVSGVDAKLRDFTRIRGVSGGQMGTAGYGALEGTISGGAYGMQLADVGLDRDTFLGIAQTSIGNRGTSRDWFSETMGQYTLERSLNLKQGSLTEASTLDRYGKNVTDAVVGMVNMLSGMSGAGAKTGVSFYDFAQVQEKFGIQQGIMRGYLGTTDKPSYNAANTMLGALSSINGITQDSRISGDIQSLQNMVRNPMNDRMRAMKYDVAADLFPEAGGSLAKLDLMMTKPENENKMIQAMVQRITKQFGEVDPNKGGEMGYWALKSVLPGITPDRAIEISKGISSGNAGNILKTGGGFGAGFETNGVDKQTYIKQSQEIVVAIDKASNSLKNGLTEMVMKFFGSNNPK